MESDDKFWKLSEPKIIKTQSEFLKLLKTSDHIHNALYRDDFLRRPEGNPKLKINGKKFERVSFSKTELTDVSFTDCDFIDCLFIGTTINNCGFRNCRFEMCNVFKIEIASTYIDPRCFSKCLDTKKHRNIGVHLYQRLMKNSNNEDQVEHERIAHFLFLKWMRYLDLDRASSSKKDKEYFSFVKHLLSWFSRWSWEQIFGSGLRIRIYLRTVFLAIATLSFASYSLQSYLGLERSNTGPEKSSEFLTILDAAYFTIISLTTLGYGDITPTTEVGQIYSALQAMVGFSMFAIAASMIFARISP